MSPITVPRKFSGVTTSTANIGSSRTGFAIPFRWEVAAYVSLAAIALLLRLWGLGEQAVHHDESLHGFFAWQIYEGRPYLHNPLTHGMLHFDAIAGSFFLFGDTDFTMRVPMAFAMGLVGICGFGYLRGVGPALNLLTTSPIRVITDFSLTLVPFFILMGSFAASAGITTDLYRMAKACVGHLPGGLAIATTWGTALWSAISGSSTATAAVMGRMAVPEMLSYGYDRRLASGCDNACSQSAYAVSGTRAGPPRIRDVGHPL